MKQRLYVGNLPYNISENDLSNLFSRFGPVFSARIVTDEYDGRSKGFGFVEMECEASADKAIANLNGSEVQGRNLRVDKAKPRVSRKGWGGPRAYRGGSRY